MRPRNEPGDHTSCPPALTAHDDFDSAAARLTIRTDLPTLRGPATRMLWFQPASPARRWPARCATGPARRPGSRSRPVPARRPRRARAWLRGPGRGRGPCGPGLAPSPASSSGSMCSDPGSSCMPGCQYRSPNSRCWYWATSLRSWASSARSAEASWPARPSGWPFRAFTMPPAGPARPARRSRPGARPGPECRPRRGRSRHGPRIRGSGGR